jgi:hypothetical protein
MSAQATKLRDEAEAIYKNISTEEATPEYQNLTGQDKYEAGREKHEAEKVAEQNLAEAKKLKTSAENSEATFKMFTKQAAAGRETAERLRRL